MSANESNIYYGMYPYLSNSLSFVSFVLIHQTQHNTFSSFTGDEIVMIIH